MKYSEFIDLYEKLFSTSKKLEKVDLLADFLKNLHKQGNSKWIYLLRGKVLPDYDTREFGISQQSVMKAIKFAYGVNSEKIMEIYKKSGDLGDIAFELAEKRRQNVLFSSRLSVGKVFENLQKILDVAGKGAVDKRISFVAELLTSASGREARYIIRTLLGELRVGVADALLIGAIVKAYYDGEMKEKIEYAYNLANDFALVFDAAAKGEEEIRKINIVPGRPNKVMLPVKVEEISEAFRICGKPAALEHKYDGFRMLINKNGEEIKLFTRNLENVTLQFPDVVKTVRKNVKGDSFILDSEVVGYDPKTKKYEPFESISQRIKRKYDIEKLILELPVEINVFDIIYYNGKSLLEEIFSERRKIVEKIVKIENMKIRPSFILFTDDEKKALEFYENALKIGEEGIIVKKLDAPYKPGRRTGYMVKLKPIAADLDLVIVGAEYGSGKRAGWLTSYIVACSHEGKFLEVGMVSSGLKEKGEGTSYEEMTKLLKSLIVKEEGKKVIVNPKIVVSVAYQNIQSSPSYSAGYALRFPRIINYRIDRDIGDIATLKDIKREAEKERYRKM
ncbi:MAG: ATP-dependent DNA ligase [Nanoarchaeota archaeon]